MHRSCIFFLRSLFVRVLPSCVTSSCAHDKDSRSKYCLDIMWWIAQRHSGTLWSPDRRPPKFFHDATFDNFPLKLRNRERKKWNSVTKEKVVQQPDVVIRFFNGKAGRNYRAVNKMTRSIIICSTASLSSEIFLISCPFWKMMKIWNSRSRDKTRRGSVSQWNVPEC